LFICQGLMVIAMNKNATMRILINTITHMNEKAAAKKKKIATKSASRAGIM